ncbi:MAG: TIGR01906 family membrane protein [Anaerolineaceae bacterium]
MNKIRFFFLGFISLLIPFFLIMTSVRLLLNPFFIQLEYNAPGFPADTYGFTQEERLKWANPSLEYLINGGGVEFLADLKFEDGTPIYNERELSHMLDVKTLIQKMIIVWNMILFLLAVSALLAWRVGWGRELLMSISRGGWLTLGLIAAILVGVFTGFSALFTEFHRIFFSGDTWLFLYSDTLIRLFPMRLWQDAFILMGIFTLAGGLVCGLGGRYFYRKM